MRTQDAPAVYELNASIYFWKREACFRQKGPFCKKTFLKYGISKSKLILNPYGVDIKNFRPEKKKR